MRSLRGKGRVSHKEIEMHTLTINCGALMVEIAAAAEEKRINATSPELR